MKPKQHCFNVYSKVVCKLFQIQLVSSWSHSLQHLKGSYIPVLELPGKLQPKVLGIQKSLLAYGILHIPVLSVYWALLSLLGVQQTLVHQLLDFLHLLDLLNASNTALDPVQHIHRHPNWIPHTICAGYNPAIS